MMLYVVIELSSGGRAAITRAISAGVNTAVVASGPTSSATMLSAWRIPVQVARARRGG